MRAAVDRRRVEGASGEAHRLASLRHRVVRAFHERSRPRQRLTGGVFLAAPQVEHDLGAEAEGTHGGLRGRSGPAPIR